MSETQFYNPRWKKNDIIRNTTTGEPYKVVHIHWNSCTEVTPLTAGLTPSLILHPRDYSNFAVDHDFATISDQISYQPINV